MAEAHRSDEDDESYTATPDNGAAGAELVVSKHAESLALVDSATSKPRIGGFSGEIQYNSVEEAIQAAEEASLRAEEAIMFYRASFGFARERRLIENAAKANKMSVNAVIQSLHPQGRFAELYAKVQAIRGIAPEEGK